MRSSTTRVVDVEQIAVDVYTLRRALRFPEQTHVPFQRRAILRYRNVVPAFSAETSTPWLPQPTSSDGHTSSLREGAAVLGNTPQRRQLQRDWRLPAALA